VELEAALNVAPTADRTRFDVAAGCLVGSRCANCNAVSWPGRAVCHGCGLPRMAEAAFAPTGQLESHTTVWVARAGIEPPYMLGQVKLDDGPLIFGHVRGLDGEARVPVPVRITIAADENAAPRFWFEPEQGGHR
jgi:hypothetical protein